MPVLRMLAARPEHLSPAERQERQSRRANIRKIAEEFAHAKILANDRDIGKRKFDDMSVADQQLVQEFDSERLHKRRNNILWRGCRRSARKGPPRVLLHTKPQ